MDLTWAWMSSSCKKKKKDFLSYQYTLLSSKCANNQEKQPSFTEYMENLEPRGIIQGIV